MSIEIKIGKRDAVARVCGVELARLRRVGGDWRAVYDGHAGFFSVLDGAVHGDAVRAWLTDRARVVAVGMLEAARNDVRWREGQLENARKALVFCEGEVPKARAELARAERVAAALVADVLEGTL